MMRGAQQSHSSMVSYSQPRSSMGHYSQGGQPPPTNMPGYNPAYPQPNQYQVIHCVHDNTINAANVYSDLGMTLMSLCKMFAGREDDASESVHAESNVATAAGRPTQSATIRSVLHQPAL